MTSSGLLQHIRSHRLAVQTSVSPSGRPQAAVVGIAVSNAFELVFDSLDTSRKVQNLRRNPCISFVIGGLANGEESTVQYEGIADEPAGAELQRLQEIYLREFPDGLVRQSWPGLVYVRARPTWIRYSNFHHVPAEIIEFTSEQLQHHGQND